MPRLQSTAAIAPSTASTHGLTRSTSSGLRYIHTRQQLLVHYRSAHCRRTAPGRRAAYPNPDHAPEEGQGTGVGPQPLDDSDMDMQDVLAALLGGPAQGLEQEQWDLPKAPLLTSFDLEGVADYIQQGKARSIVVMCGAGISVNAGIPDFRTPGTGLYSQLERYKLPNPEAVFEINYFKRNPRPFHMLAKELFPGNFTPTPTHVFLRLLHEKGLLRRVYTQNIDSLESQAGLPKDKIVAAHGNFDGAHCIRCDTSYPTDYVKKAVLADSICYCSNGRCKGLVKPDIVFFGEQLPARFHELYEEDFGAADLLVVMGTSLVVNPFASLVDAVDDDVPRLLINRERVGEIGGRLRGKFGQGFTFPPPAYFQAPAGASTGVAGALGDTQGSSSPAGGGDAGSSTAAVSKDTASSDSSDPAQAQDSDRGTPDASVVLADESEGTSAGKASAAASTSSATAAKAADVDGQQAAVSEPTAHPHTAVSARTADSSEAQQEGVQAAAGPCGPSTTATAAAAPAGAENTGAAAKADLSTPSPPPAAPAATERDRGHCYRDALFLGDCDQGVGRLVDLLTWREEFDQLLAEVRKAHPGVAGHQVKDHVLGDNAEEEQVPPV